MAIRQQAHGFPTRTVATALAMLAALAVAFSAGSVLSRSNQGANPVIHAPSTQPVSTPGSLPDPNYSGPGLRPTTHGSLP
jgi:hypothetical protein